MRRFFNLGSTDEYGRQRRIEHRGRYLRASRTGGVALRAQAKAAGVNLTGNTRRGVRVSATPLKNTQLAVQNGRFVLKGRYGQGPTRLNVSKTGATISTRNRLGSFNWIKPNRSSARIAGVQVRGRTAAQLQLVYMAFAAAGMAFKAMVWLLMVFARITTTVAAELYRIGLTTPHVLNGIRRRLRNRRLARQVPGFEGDEHRPAADEGGLKAALVVAYCAWGRGQDPSTVTSALQQRLGAAGGDFPRLQDAMGRLPHAVGALERQRRQAEAPAIWPLVAIAGTANSLAQTMPAEALAALLYELDELTLMDGHRTRLQQDMVEVFADFAGLRVEAAPDDEAPTHPEEGGDSTSNPEDAPVIDLNSASLGALQALPHVGPERAQQIITMRPLRDVAELCAVDGIGPSRLEDIRAYGVYCSTH